MKPKRSTAIIRGAVWGGLTAFAAAIVAYVLIVHVADYPPGLDGDRFMASSLILGLMGAPLSIVLFDLIGDGSVPTALYYAAYLVPIVLNGAALGVIFVVMQRLVSQNHKASI